MNVTLNIMPKELFWTEDSLTNRISFWHVVLFLASLPFDRFYSELILISLAIHTAIHLRHVRIKDVSFKRIFILQSVYLFTMVATIYSAGRQEAFSLWERQLAIFLFPLILSLNPLNIRRYRNTFLFIFALSCTVTILYLYYDAFHIIFYNHLPFSAIFSRFFINQNFSRPINLHATYLSMYAALSFTYFAVSFKEQSHNRTKWLYALAMLVLCSGLVQLGSKAILPAVLLIANIVLPFNFKKGIRRQSFTALSILLSIIVVFAIFQNKGLKQRYFTGLRADFSESRNSYEISDPRMLRWKLAFDLIKASPVIGYGAGEETRMLKETYFRNKLYNSYLHDLNAHNEYLSFLLRGGAFGLAIYLMALAFGFLTAIRNKDLTFLGFLIIIALVSLSENYLDVNKGIFFYAFFFSFFVLAPLSPPNKRITETKGLPGNL